LMVAAGFTVAMLLVPSAARRAGSGGRRLLTVVFFGTLLGLSGAIGFHLCLMLFGWGFWLWSLPTLTVLALCFVREIRRTP